MPTRLLLEGLPTMLLAMSCSFGIVDSTIGPGPKPRRLRAEAAAGSGKADVDLRLPGG